MWPQFRPGVKTLPTNFFPVTNAVWKRKIVKIISFCTMVGSPGNLHNTGRVFIQLIHILDFVQLCCVIGPAQVLGRINGIFSTSLLHLSSPALRWSFIKLAPSISMECWIHFFAFSCIPCKARLCSPDNGLLSGLYECTSVLPSHYRLQTQSSQSTVCSPWL